MEMKLFLTAFMQVFLVSANTYFIAETFYPGIAIAGFGISYRLAVWCRFALQTLSTYRSP